jgi:hypothetical protein
MFGKPVPKYECGRYVLDPFDVLVQEMVLQTMDSSKNSVDTPQCSGAVSGLLGPYIVGAPCCDVTGGQYLGVTPPTQLLSGISGSNTFMQCNRLPCRPLPSTYGTCLGGSSLYYSTSTPIGTMPILGGPGSVLM